MITETDSLSLDYDGPFSFSEFRKAEGSERDQEAQHAMPGRRLLYLVLILSERLIPTNLYTSFPIGSKAWPDLIE